MTPLAHGGTVGLAAEIGTAVALTVLMVWALWKSRGDGNDEGPT